MIGALPDLSNPRRWTITGLLFAAGFINYFDRALLSVALPVIAVKLHLGPAAKGVLLSAFFWSYALMQVPMGWCSDRFNLRWMYAAGFTLWSLACGFTALAGSLAVLMVFRVLLGIGESVYLPGGMKIVSLLFTAKDRGLASGIVNCGTRAGLAFGAPIIGWMVVHLGWQRAFALVGFSSLVWLAPWLAAYPKRNAGAKHGADAGPRSFGFNRSLLGLCLAHLGYSYYWYLLVTWLPDYLVVARHMPIQTAASYATIPYLVFAISEPLGGWIADRLVRAGRDEMRVRKSIITCAFFSSVMLIPAGRLAGDASAVWLIGGASLVGMSTGNILALLQRVAREDEVGLWSGILNFAGNVSGVIAPITTGLLIAATGSYFPAFVVGVVVLLAALPAYWWMVGDPVPAVPGVSHANQSV